MYDISIYIIVLSIILSIKQKTCVSKMFDRLWYMNVTKRKPIFQLNVNHLYQFSIRKKTYTYRSQDTSWACSTDSLRSKWAAGGTRRNSGSRTRSKELWSGWCSTGSGCLTWRPTEIRGPVAKETPNNCRRFWTDWTNTLCWTPCNR